MRAVALRKRFVCPCCGYAELDVPPYAGPAEAHLLHWQSPPYDLIAGEASYAVCPCCGFEFGNDDNPGTAVGASFEDYLAEWVADGMLWFDPSLKPEGWSLKDQLRAANIVGAKAIA